MKTNKALPDDVDQFFKGASVFFNTPTEGEKKKETKLITSNEPVSNAGRKIGTKHKPSSIPQNKIDESNSVSSSEPNERTVKPNGASERSSIMLELAGEIKEVEQRKTERYSFEIYVDQIGTIEDLQYRYKKKTGKRLSSSRIIREALDEYLKKAEKTI